MPRVVLDVQKVQQMGPNRLYRYLMKYIRHYPSSNRQLIWVEAKESNIYPISMFLASNRLEKALIHVQRLFLSYLELIELRFQETLAARRRKTDKNRSEKSQNGPC
jgi:hypothetical protein